MQNRTDLPDTLITTFTGTERRGLDRFGGDGGPATQAQLNAPSGVTVDGAGNVYIADTWNHRIRRVDPWGYISTDAGSGSFGDYGPATQALFHLPGDVALDDVGNVYIADTWNHRIRRVDPSGGRIITTIAGTGGRGFFGHGASAIIAWLNTPYGVVVDGAGNVYIADSGNHRIRRVDPSGIITTIAGSGERGLDRFGGDGGPAVQARLNNPRGVAVDGAGNVYIADTFNHRIRKVDSSGVITTIAGSGEEGFSGDGSPATQAQLYYPSGVALDGAGNLYIADTANHRIRKMDSSGVITTIAGTGERGFGGDGGPATAARLNNPRGVAVDGAGNVYIAAFNHRIRKVDSSGVITTIAGSGERGFSGDGGPAVQARLNAPRNVTADAAGNLYIADQSNNRIRVLKTNPLQTGPTTPPAGPQPAADGTITTIAGTGEEGFGGDGGPAVQARLSFPTGVAVDDAGNVYIAVQSSHRIRKVDSTGTITTVAGDGMEGFGGDGGPAAQAQLTNPRGVAVDGAGNLYIADTGNHRIRKVDATGTITTIAGTTEERVCDPRCRDRGPAVMARLNFPLGVAVDGAGNLYIADSDNHRVRKVDSTGTIATIAGDGTEGFSGDGDTATAAQLSYPAGVAVDGAGNVYISDTTTDRIRRVDSTGTITTIAGDGTEGFGGDGGAATAAQLNFPVGVAVDDAGNLYIADYYNHRVRKVDSTGTITTIAGTGDHGYGGDGGPAAQARLTAPSDVAADNAGNLYIADQGNNRIRVVKTNPLQTGDQIYYFPHLAVGASWQTTITYINYSPEEVTCQTDFLSDHGSPLMVSFADKGTVPSRTDVLLPGGSVHQETNVELNAPFAPGWARATCSGPVKASLLFRLHNSEGVPIAEGGVNAAAVPATRFVTFAEQGEGKQGTGVAYANPSATSALVTFKARDADGQMLASVDKNLSPNGHAAQNMAPLFGLTSFTGSIEVTSTAPIVSLSINAEAAPVFSSLPPGELDAAAQGSTTYYFPHLAVGASWQTTITYINYSSQEVRCQTDFISDHGSPLMVSFAALGTVVSRTDVLLPGGSVHQETNVELNAPFAPGWARATCSGPVKASLLFRLHNSEGVPIAEGGVNAAAVPATRFVTFAEQGEGKQGTGVAYANPSATSALVTFKARDADGQMLASVDKNLSPNGHAAQNMAPLFGLTSFTGSIEVTSTAPIVSLSINAEAAPVFSSLPPGETVDPQ